MIENEVKYVLQLNTRIKKLKSTHIRQGYDKNGARVRQQDSKYTFNYKWKNGISVEEFEKKITKNEFVRCYENCVDKLEKTRYTIHDEWQNTWDIDFFYSDKELYFVMAECELVDPHAMGPEKIIPILEPFVVYVVPREDGSNFSSRKLSDPEYAMKLLAEIKMTSTEMDSDCKSC